MLLLDEQTQFYKSVTKTSCGLEQRFGLNMLIWKNGFQHISFKKEKERTITVPVIALSLLSDNGRSHRCRGRSCRCERWRSAGGGRWSWQWKGRGTESHTPTPGDAFLNGKDTNTHRKNKHFAYPGFSGEETSRSWERSAPVCCISGLAEVPATTGRTTLPPYWGSKDHSATMAGCVCVSRVLIWNQ